MTESKRVIHHFRPLITRFNLVTKFIIEFLQEKKSLLQIENQNKLYIIRTRFMPIFPFNHIFHTACVISPVFVCNPYSLLKTYPDFASLFGEIVSINI